MLGYYWSSVCDAGTALHKHWFPTFHVKTLLQHEANIGSTSRPGVLGIRPALCPDICVRYILLYIWRLKGHAQV